MMFVYTILVVRNRMDFYRARLAWHENEDRRKYHLVKWAVVCQPKDQGGLGVLNNY
jgi:hypothetical protein